MQVAKIQQAQERLIAALDACDAHAILEASGDLSGLIDEIEDISALYADAETREALEHVKRLSHAAAHRLRVLTDQTRERLQMLGVDEGPLLYGPRAA